MMASYNVSEAKKGKGIDEIIFRLQPQPVDDLKIVPSSAPNQFQDLLAKYQRFLDRSIEAKGGIYGWYTAMEKAVEQYFPERLTPAEINIFLQMSMGTEGHPNYNRADYIITQLIQNSYALMFPQETKLSWLPRTDGKIPSKELKNRQNDKNQTKRQNE